MLTEGINSPIYRHTTIASYIARHIKAYLSIFFFISKLNVRLFRSLDQASHFTNTHTYINTSSSSYCKCLPYVQQYNSHCIHSIRPTGGQAAYIARLVVDEAVLEHESEVIDTLLAAVVDIVL